ncbi:MAG: hypothetical protein CME26_12375 [Gemmatimonadetes bacterium]|nr:hypothetical protein [Gemmatimonadota bacterium]
MTEKREPTWRVLVIDNDRLFLEIVDLSLTRSGCEVHVAADPREGLNEALKGLRRSSASSSP